MGGLRVEAAARPRHRAGTPQGGYTCSTRPPCRQENKTEEKSPSDPPSHLTESDYDHDTNAKTHQTEKNRANAISQCIPSGSLHALDADMEEHAIDKYGLHRGAYPASDICQY